MTFTDEILTGVTAERSIPFFRTLKHQLGKDRVAWTTEAEDALQALKKNLQPLPTLASPEEGEPLIVYLSTSNEAVSSVLLAERQKIQVPVYFVSRALQGAEINYSQIEKLVLTLVHTARRLRRYFQAHPITVLTDQAIRQILMQPERSGRLTKWAIELGEYNIAYQRRVSMKGQALVDFLTKIPDKIENNDNNEPITQSITKTASETQEGPNDMWILYTDGASSADGSGAGIILTSPLGDKSTYALRFDFKCSNNEEEYDALLAGMRLAHSMGVTKLEAKGDSLLVAN